MHDDPPIFATFGVISQRALGTTLASGWNYSSLCVSLPWLQGRAEIREKVLEKRLFLPRPFAFFRFFPNFEGLYLSQRLDPCALLVVCGRF